MRFIRKNQYGVDETSLTLIEDGEVIKTLDGEIIPYDGIPKHDSREQILPDGTIKKVKKGDGGAIVNAVAVLSDTTNPNKNRGKNSPKQVPFHFKFKKGEEFLGLKFKKGKSGSPSQMFKYLQNLRDKELKKYDKIEYNEHDDVSLETQELNEIVKNQLPTDEEIFDGLLEIQEINKDISGEDFNETVKAQSGMDEERRLAIAQTHPDIFRKYGNIIRGYTRDVIKDPKNIITKIPKVARSIPGPVKLGLIGMEMYDAIEDGIEDSIEKTGYYPPTMGSDGGIGTPRIKGKFQYGGYNEWRESLPQNLQDTTYYNLRGAYEAGLKPELVDGEYHLPSRNPKTGEILKSTNHPTFQTTLDEDVKLGYIPYVNDSTGKIHTFNKPPKKGYKPYQYGGIPRNINGLYEEDGPVIVPTPDGSITMNGINQNVLAIDPYTGELLEYMEPGGEYQFDTDEILEIPVAQGGFGGGGAGGFYTPDSINTTYYKTNKSEIDEIAKLLTTGTDAKKLNRLLSKHQDFVIANINENAIPTINLDEVTVRGVSPLTNFMRNIRTRYNINYPNSPLNPNRSQTLNQFYQDAGILSQDQPVNTVPPTEEIEKLRQAEIDYKNRNKKNNNTVPGPPKPTMQDQLDALIPPARTFDGMDIQPIERRTFDTPEGRAIAPIDARETTGENPLAAQLQNRVDNMRQEVDRVISREGENPINSLRNKLGRIRTDRGLNQIREAINQLSSGVMPEYMSDATNVRTLTPIEIDPTPYLDEVDSAVARGLQNVNMNTAQGQAIATNALMNALRNKRSILNQINSQNQNIRRQVQDQNNQILSAAEVRDDANRKDYFTRTQQADAAYNMNKMNLATQLDRIHNERVNIDNVFTLENMRNPNYQIDEFGNVYRVKTKDWNVNPTSAKFGKRKYIKRK